MRCIEWDALIREFFELINSSCAADVKTHIRPPNCNYGDGTTALDVLRQKAKGLDTSQNTKANQIKALWNAPASKTTIDFAHFLQPLDRARRNLKHLIPTTMTAHEFINEMIQTIAMINLEDDPRYKPVFQVWKADPNLTDATLRVKTRAYEGTHQFKELDNEHKSLQTTSSPDKILSSNALQGTAPANKTKTTNQDKKKFYYHPDVDQSVGICHHWMMKENCIKTDCKFRHKFVRPEFENVLAALISPKSKDMLISVGRQADDGRPSLFTRQAAYHIPPEAIPTVLRHPLTTKVATRSNIPKWATNHMIRPCVCPPG